MIATKEDIPAIQKLFNKHWEMVSDDYSVKDSFTLTPQHLHLYLDNFYVLVSPLTETMADIHIVSDSNSKENSFKVFEFLSTHTNIKNLIAHIPAYNKRCVRFVEILRF